MRRCRFLTSVETSFETTFREKKRRPTKEDFFLAFILNFEIGLGHLIDRSLAPS